MSSDVLHPERKKAVEMKSVSTLVILVGKAGGELISHNVLMNCSGKSTPSQNHELIAYYH